VPEALVVLASYVAGSIPFALLLGSVFGGTDIRTFGSGNIGATNLGRALGGRWFCICFVLDAAKGALPVLLLAPLAGDGLPDGTMPVLCALAAVLGHVFSMFLRFRGGKGVATTAGAVAALSPLSAVGGLGVFLLVFLTTRWVSLASVVAAVAFPVVAYLLDGRQAVFVFALVVALLVVVKHRTNIVRLAQGTEPKIAVGRRTSGTHPEEEKS